MMYQACVALPKQSAFDALQRLFGEKDISMYLDRVDKGSINYENSGSGSVLELQIKFTERTQLLVLRAKIPAKNGHEEAPIGYRILEEIYRTMKERYGGAITPLGLIGPSKGIELSYYVEEQDATNGGNISLRPVDISRICLN